MKIIVAVITDIAVLASSTCTVSYILPRCRYFLFFPHQFIPDRSLHPRYCYTTTRPEEESANEWAGDGGDEEGTCGGECSKRLFFAYSHDSVMTNSV
jgi:hypothetical protein